MIAIRLKFFLEDIISPALSVFLPRRLFTDNILPAYESMHAIRNKKKGKWSYRAVNLDMYKAYDHVEW